MRVIVTGDNGEQTSVPSTTVGPIDAAPPVSVTVPAISGTAGAGHTLTAGDGTWSGTHPLDYTYQWQRCDADGSNCTDIAGATDSTYDLTGTRRRPRDPRGGHRHQRRRRRHRRLRPDRRDAARAAGQHDPARGAERHGASTAAR